MNQKNLNRLSMWQVVHAVLQKNKTVWEGNNAFSEAVTDLKALIDAAVLAAKKQTDGETTGITMDKNDLADTAIAQTLRITKLARAFARKTSNHKLFEAVDFDKSALANTPLSQLETRLHSMLDAVVPMIGKLTDYGYQKGWDAEATDAVKAFHDATPSTRVAISDRSSVTDSVPDIIRAGRAELLFIDDLIHLYDEDAPGFVSAYKSARVIVDTGGMKQQPPN